MLSSRWVTPAASWMHPSLVIPGLHVPNVTVQGLCSLKSIFCGFNLRGLHWAVSELLIVDNALQGEKRFQPSWQGLQIARVWNAMAVEHTAGTVSRQWFAALSNQPYSHWLGSRLGPLLMGMPSTTSARQKACHISAFVTLNPHFDTIWQKEGSFLLVSRVSVIADVVCIQPKKAEGNCLFFVLII